MGCEPCESYGKQSCDEAEEDESAVPHLIEVNRIELNEEVDGERNLEDEGIHLEGEAFVNQAYVTQEVT